MVFYILVDVLFLIPITEARGSLGSGKALLRNGDFSKPHPTAGRSL